MVIKRCWASVWGAGGAQPQARASQERGRRKSLVAGTRLYLSLVPSHLGQSRFASGVSIWGQQEPPPPRTPVKPRTAQEQPTTSRPTAPGKQGFGSQHISYLMFPTS